MTRRLLLMRLMDDHLIRNVATLLELVTQRETPTHVSQSVSKCEVETDRPVNSFIGYK